MNCVKCGGQTEGWKCAVCGSESSAHDPNHKHADSDRYYTMKCKDCGKTDVQCDCGATRQASV